MRFRKPLWPSLCVALLAGTFFVSPGDFAQAQKALPKPAPSAAFPGLAAPEEPKDIINQLLASGKIIRSSDVKRGMRGYGLSVFQGTTIEKFPVEVLGVLQKVNGGGDIVLIKVLGGTVVKRNSGIVAGMSGSPVYINGKMLGAIALGWGFPKEPIGGVTPITEMLQTSLPKETPSSRVAALAPSDHTAPNVYAPREALNVGGKNIKRVVIAKNATRLALNDVIADAQHNPDTAVMRPTSTLLQVSGFSQDSLAKLKKVFEPYGLEPFIGPSSKKTDVASPKIEPGAAVGVQLVSGDMDQTAVGTITFRWGNRVLAFGHPMFGQGATSLPMTSAYVYDIFPSYQSSFKLASPMKIVGAVQQDTQFAIGGTMNVKADTIPMSITLVDANRHINKTFHVQVMNDPLLTPQLVVMVAQQAVEGTLGLTSDKMVDVAMRMDVEGAKPIIRHNLLYSGGVVSRAALTDLMQSISLVQGNQFAKGRIRDISLEVSVRDGRNIAAIKTITANRNKVKAGESVQINVVLQPTADPTQRITRTFTFTVPADAPAGTMRLAAASAANFWPLQVAVGGPAPDPTSLPELISAWNKVGSLNDLVVMASTPQHFLRVDQQDVQNPPPAWSKLLGNSPSTGIERYNLVDMQHAVLNYAIDGAKILRIPVESAHKNNASTSSADDSDDDDSVDSTDDTTPDNSSMDNSAADTGDDTSTKSTFDITSGKLNSTQNWIKTSWNDKLTIPDLIPYQVVPGASSVKASDKETDKKSAADTAAAVAAAIKAAEAATEEPSATATPPTTLGTKTLGRPALNWVDTGTANFLQGEFKSAIVDSNGVVRPAPLPQQLVTTSLPFIWSIAGDNSHNVYLGSGENNNAEIYRVNAAGEKSLFFKTAGIAVTSLTVDSSNNVYAAVSPGGKVYKISPDGKSRLIFDSGQPFVWALTWDADGQLLVGTGGEHGKLYSILTNTSFPADPLPLHVFTEGHVRAVSVAPNGKIYVGTGAAGVLYQVDPASGDAKALYEVTAPGGNRNGEVLAVAASSQGVYFGTSVNGTFYRWTPEAGAVALYPSPQKTVYALQLNTDGTLYMATGDSGVVYHMTPGDSAATTRAARILEPTQQQALSLYLTHGSDSRLLVGMGNNGAAYEIPAANAPSGVFTSRVFDTQSKVQWGALRAVKDSATLMTRSGNTSVPDATWSDWQNLKSLSDGQMQVASPDSRYLQYKVLLDGNANPSSAFARVEISYRTENQPPVLALSAPKNGTFWKGKKSITWTGTDPDKDTLLYNLSLLTPDKQWKEVNDDEPLKDSPFSLDTTKWADGSYQLKITASDMLSNPLHPKTATVQTLPFIIDNTPPVITGSRVEVRNKVRYINADISDATSPVVGVEWRIATKATNDDSSDTTASDETSTGINPNPNKASNSLTISTGDKLVGNMTGDTGESIAANSDDTDETAAGSNDTDDAAADQDDDSTSGGDTATDATTSAKTKTDVDGWHALSALDGLFDSRQESAIGILQFTQKQIDAQNGKPFKIELRAHDAAGNIVTLTIEVPV